MGFFQSFVFRTPLISPSQVFILFFQVLLYFFDCTKGTKRSKKWETTRPGKKLGDAFAKESRRRKQQNAVTFGCQSITANTASRWRQNDVTRRRRRGCHSITQTAQEQNKSLEKPPSARGRWMELQANQTEDQLTTNFWPKPNLTAKNFETAKLGIWDSRAATSYLISRFDSRKNGNHGVRPEILNRVWRSPEDVRAATTSSKENKKSSDEDWQSAAHVVAGISLSKENKISFDEEWRKIIRWKLTIIRRYCCCDIVIKREEYIIRWRLTKDHSMRSLKCPKGCPSFSSSSCRCWSYWENFKDAFHGFILCFAVTFFF